MKILFIGDIFGKPGRLMVKNHLTELKQKKNIDFIIANAENCSHGKGLTWSHYNFLKEAGIEFFTMGNHTWAKRDILEILTKRNDIIRPLNLDQSYEHHNIGIGTTVVKVKSKKIRISNFLGESVALPFKITNPFKELESLIKKEHSDLHIVDFHAETTSEKNAFGIYFDGQVSAILGTHTHVPTNDLRVTPKKTVYITDVGMCGPGFGSIIGAKAESVIAHFLNPELKFKLEVSEFGSQLNAVLMEFDDQLNIPISCEQIRIVHDSDAYLNWTCRN